MFASLHKFSLGFYPLARKGFALLPLAIQHRFKRKVREGMAARNAKAAAMAPLRAHSGHIEVSGLDPSLKPGVNAVGYVRGDLSLGVSLRAMLRALETFGVPTGAVNFTQALQHAQQDDSHVHLISHDPGFVASLFNLTADALTLCHNARPDLFAGRYNIHYTAWELAKYPAIWMPAMNLVHEIWAISTFMQQAVAPYATIPVLSMGIAVECPVTESHPRNSFGLPERMFLFLFSFDISSVTERKNPEACLRAFTQAFPEGRSDVGIAVKINFIAARSDHVEKVRALRKAWAHDRRILFIDQVLSRPAMVSLLDACDAYISLHRAEGFGLGIAEAMALRKPVIVTNYSGNTDFTRFHNACLVDYQLIPVKPGQYIFEEGQVWADADTGHAAHYMRKLVEDKALYDRLAQAGHETIRDEFSHKAIGAKAHARLKLLGLI